MPIIIDVLKEEQERIERNEKIYQQELDELPKGSLVKKKRGNREYFYISYRVEGRTKQEYLKMSPEEIDELKTKIEKRRRLEQSLRKLKQEKKLVIRMVSMNELQK